ncbi:MAG: aminotransferase class IV [Romboutsia sp.]
MKSNVSFDSELSKFGIGLFETIYVKKEPISLELHMDRMFNSIKELDLNISYKREYLEYEIKEYIKKNNIYNMALRITVFDEGYNISARNILYNQKFYDKGFKLNISPIKRGDSIIYKHKTTNYFENIYTKDFANNNGYNDGIFLDLNDVILECSMSNIFFIKDKVIYTPSKTLPILKGTMRKRIMDICEEVDIEIIEKKITISEIKNFEFVFVTNSLMKVMKVTNIENIFYNDKNELFDKILAYI